MIKRDTNLRLLTYDDDNDVCLLTLCLQKSGRGTVVEDV